MAAEVAASFELSTTRRRLPAAGSTASSGCRGRRRSAHRRPHAIEEAKLTGTPGGDGVLRASARWGACAERIAPRRPRTALEAPHAA
jgi:hypothetical protein